MRDHRAFDPFRPGTGGLPPYLAGRETEQDLFRESLERLRRGISAPAEIILYGPRGNGKTALLRWVRRQVEADDALDVCWLTPAEVRDPDALARHLRVTSWLDRLAHDGVSVAGVGVSLRQSDAQPMLTEALRARAKEQPLLVLLDEAHTLKPSVGNLLLNAAQDAGREAPFLLVLAGTPDLHARLSEMAASFWSRAEGLPVGRLGETAAAEAIRQPLSEEGVEIEIEALKRIARTSHGYPFFLQVWGSAVWKSLREPPAARRVSSAVVEAAALKFEKRKDHCYLQRYEELRVRSLLPAAREVAIAFGEAKTLSDPALDSALERAASTGGPAPGEAEESLKHLGFIWRAGTTPTWEPGIPSLMDYILEHTAELTASR